MLETTNPLTTSNGMPAEAVTESKAQSKEIHSEPSDRSAAPAPPHRPASKDPYRGVILLLLALSLLGTAAGIRAGRLTGNPVLFDAALALGLSSAILIGVAATRMVRPKRSAKAARPLPPVSPKLLRGLAPVLTRIRDRVRRRWRELGRAGIIAGAAGLSGLIAIVFILRARFTELPSTPFAAVMIAGICLAAAGIAATAVRYLSELDPAVMPEAPGLCRGSRMVAWILGAAALSVGLAWARLSTAVQLLHFAILAIDVAVCWSLLRVRQPGDSEVFPLDFAVASLLGGRSDIVGSVLDAAERSLGIDIRSTWALMVLRRSLEPLALSLLLVGWLSTCFTVVGLQEQGIQERLGVPAPGPPLMPGLHAHLPWPVDRVYRMPVLRVQSIAIGHEGQQQSGPENVLWARQHAENEYTLLLGNGRDLITIDTAVQFRISDARAWRYNCRNPMDALRAIAYRAVTRDTVSRTLNEALSENVATLTADMRSAIQRDANALGLGVEVVAFTVGGMHPPVAVAGAYQAVISAEIGKATAILDAQVSRIQTLPFAESEAVRNENAARAEGAEALATAAGEAWSFRTLESQYRAAPAEYAFRRRLETLEKGLAGRRYVVVDNRYQRDGGQLWIVP